MKFSAVNFYGLFSNLKLERRCNSFFDSMVKHESVSIHKISRNWPDTMGNYRMFDNKKVTSEGIKEALINDCALNAHCNHALLIQDTTQPNYENHRGRIKPNSGLGTIGDNKSLGYFMHPTLVMNAEQGDVYGVCNIQTWIREEGREVRKDWVRKELPIEEKKSYRWLDSILESKKVLKGCEKTTCIADREGDIFELFAIVPDNNTHLLIRSRDDRRIEEGRLYDYLSSRQILGTYALEVRGDIRKNTKTRKAIIEIKAAKVTLLKPEKLKKFAKYANKVELYAIEAKEIEQTVPTTGKAIHWRILTSHQVTTFDQAKEIVDWYSMRWNIEQLFRILQNKGLNIESSELEKGTSIIKLGIFALGAAIKIMQLLLASKWNSKQKIESVFTKDQIKCLKQLSNKYQGKTEKQKNNHKKGTLIWAAWIIARIGGWKGYESQRAPGPTTFYHGLRQFYLIYEGFSLGKDPAQLKVNQYLRL